jgi:hypothetical protein
MQPSFNTVVSRNEIETNLISKLAAKTKQETETKKTFCGIQKKTTALLEQEEEQYWTGPEAKCEVQAHLQVTSKMRIKVRLDDVPPPHD